MRPRVYISGPITKGERNINFWQACEAQSLLMRLGYAPLNPILSMLAPFAWQPEFTHDLWLAADLPWVAAADAVLRLPGESLGADMECDYARRKDIPVFDDIETLERWRDEIYATRVA